MGSGITSLGIGEHLLCLPVEWGIVKNCCSVPKPSMLLNRTEVRRSESLRSEREGTVCSDKGSSNTNNNNNVALKALLAGAETSSPFVNRYFCAAKPRGVEWATRVQVD